MIKLCPKCSVQKPTDEFGKNKLYKDGLQYCCKSCDRALDKAWQEANPEKYKLSWLRKNCKRIGITVEFYLEQLELQGGLCKICGLPNDRPGYRMSMDHDHATGEFRGLLCNRCNRVLGMVRDDTQLLYQMREYLHWSRRPK